MRYPEPRLALDMTTFNRRVRLPQAAIGQVTATDGQRVDIRDVVVRGFVPSQHIIIEAARILRLRDPDSLPLFMLAELRSRVKAQDPIAGRDAKRGRRVFAPVDGMVVYVGGGRIIMQVMPEILNLDAGVRGRVVEVEPGRGVTIQATGALIQGVWGNGRSVIAIMRMEPKEGIENIALNQLDTTYKNEIIVTMRPLTQDGLRVAEIRSFAGIIAPSINANLLEYASQAQRAILLTEGFGQIRMSSAIATLLQEFDSFQMTLDAYQPQRWEERRPEIVVNRASSTAPAPAELNIRLQRGIRVRITRDPYAGLFGKVADIPRLPIALDNGLRVPGAMIELINGDTVAVPLANLEIAGR